VDERIPSLRRLRIQRIWRKARLVWIVVAGLSKLPLGMLGDGSKLVRSGSWLPFLFICVLLSAQHWLGDHGIQRWLFYLGLIIAGLGTWALLGAITATFYLTLEEGRLCWVMKELEGVTKTKTHVRHNYELVAAQLSTSANEEGATFVLEAKEEHSRLKKEQQAIWDELRLRIKGLRESISLARKYLWVEIYVRRLGTVALIFISTVLAFGMACYALSYLDTSAYDPPGAIGYWEAVYVSFLSIVTMGGSVKPVTGAAKGLLVWEGCFGLAFFAVVVAAAVGSYRDVPADSIFLAEKGWIRALKKDAWQFFSDYHADHDKLLEPSQKSLELSLEISRMHEACKDVFEAQLAALQKQEAESLAEQGRNGSTATGHEETT